MPCPGAVAAVARQLLDGSETQKLPRLTLRHRRLCMIRLRVSSSAKERMTYPRPWSRGPKHAARGAHPKEVTEVHTQKGGRRPHIRDLSLRLRTRLDPPQPSQQLRLPGTSLPKWQIHHHRAIHRNAGLRTSHQVQKGQIEADTKQVISLSLLASTSPPLCRTAWQQIPSGRRCRTSLKDQGLRLDPEPATQSKLDLWRCRPSLEERRFR